MGLLAAWMPGLIHPRSSELGGACVRSGLANAPDEL